MKMKPKGQQQSNAIMASFFMIAMIFACSTSSGDQTTEANKLVEEGNAAVKEAQKYVAEAEALKQTMLQTPVAQLADARVTAKASIDAYDKAKEKCKEASKKYEEASKLKIKDKFKEYLTLKVKEYDKRAELVETAKGTPQALIDAKNRTSFVSMANANNERVDRLGKEADELATQSEKVQKDNADIFKS
jgi:hypothetical protein